MGERKLRTDVWVDGVRYVAGTSEGELSEVPTDVHVGGARKATKVSVADRITAAPAWVNPAPDPEEAQEPGSEQD